MHLVARLLLWIVGLSLASQAIASNRLYTEFPIASVTVGMDGTKSIRRVLTLGLVGPDATFSQIEFCTMHALKDSAAKVLVRELPKWSSHAKLVEEMAGKGVAVTAMSISAERNARSVPVVSALAELTLATQQAIIGCRGPTAEPFAKHVRVLITVRSCSPASPTICSANPLPETYQNQVVFEKLWSAFSLDGDRPLNAWHEINADKKVVQVAAVREAIEWPRVTQEVAIQQLEAYVGWLRSRQKRLSYAVPSVLDLTQRSGIHIMDVIEHPAAALPYLPDGAVTLRTVSDEIARARIKDCAMLRAQFTAERVGDCAGYQLGDDALYKCIQGQHCLPHIVNKALLSMADITSPTTLAELAKQTVMPRIGLDKLTVDAFENVIRTCAATITDQAAHARCVMESALDADDYETYRCASVVPSGSGRQSSILECAKLALSGKGFEKEFACLESNFSDPAQAIRCGLNSSLTSEQLVCVEAFRASSTTAETLASCIGAANLGSHVDRAAECLFDPNLTGDRLVMCLTRESLPPDAKLIYDCAQSGDWTAATTCIATKKIKLEGNLGRAVACGVQSGGTAVGTVACYAGSKLNPQQAIALQCAATTQEPISFAICAGGQLGFLEIMQCRASGGAFRGNCFGENNEFRRFLRFFGINPSPSSVLAHVINVHIEIISFNIALAEGAAREVARFAKNVNREVERAVREIKRVGSQIRSAGQRAEKMVKKICGKLC